jgi:DNA-binding PadR family transcriptional regulator
MPKKVHDKLKIMEYILTLGNKGDELTIYNITKKLNQNIKNLKSIDIENHYVHYVKEQTISNALKELKKLNCLEVKSIEKTKTGKEKKIYKLTENSEKIFEVYKKNYLKIHKILNVIKSEEISNDELDTISFIIKRLLKKDD